MFSSIEKIDANFAVKTQLGRDDLRFYDIQQPPFSIHGVFYENGQYVRMPGEVAEAVNPGVAQLYKHTAGGRIRFATDADAIAIAVEYDDIGRMSHFALTGSVGLDLYADGHFVKSFVPPFDMDGKFVSILPVPAGMHEITLNMPHYSGVKSLSVGLPENACVKAARPYKHTPPIVYYGSSITQGGCASRPGNTYQNILCRELDADYINLGFSGSARGEKVIADYIASLPMAVFVLDYDHNAPSTQHLWDTHERMYTIVRKAHPDIPILMLSHPSDTFAPRLAFAEERREVVAATWLHALAAGDRNVDFIDGTTFFYGRGGESCTVDGTHPNDLGFMAMAQTLLPVLRKWFA